MPEEKRKLNKDETKKVAGGGLILDSIFGPLLETKAEKEAKKKTEKFAQAHGNIIGQCARCGAPITDGDLTGGVWNQVSLCAEHYNLERNAYYHSLGELTPEEKLAQKENYSSVFED